MSETTLIAGSDTSGKLTRAELALVPAPPSTPTHQVIPHVGIVHAIEEQRLPLTRVEEALGRNRAAKQRFVRAWRPASPTQLQAMIGRDEHRAIADEMSAFV